MTDDGVTRVDAVLRLSGPVETMTSKAVTRFSDSGVAVADVPFAPGMMLAGRYRIERQLGRGGMGVIYQAEDLRLGHRVALKFLPPALARDSRRLAQFHSEVSVARQVSHANVGRVYDIGDVDGHLFLSMEYVDGEDLSAAITRRGSFPESEAVELVRQICAGLAAVHARGVLHRDLKPANIMLNSAGQAQLMDFGIATAARPASEAVEHIREGTPAYMGPEQLTGGDATAQSDIYALGLVMYEVVTGRRLLDAKTMVELTRQQKEIGSRVRADLADVVRPRIQQVILQCLEQDPSRRPESVPAVAAMLQTVVLDARATWRRILQVATQALTGPMFALSLILLRRPGPTKMIMLTALVVLAVVLVGVDLMFPLGWTARYKGHRIRFHNHPVFGERLYVDDVLADRGRVALNVTMRATLESGEGAGERITAVVQCRFHFLSCRIVAESFSAAGSA